MNELRENQKSMQDDIDRIKIALVVLPETDNRESLVKVDLHKDVESFDGFSTQLEGGSYRKLVVGMIKLFTER